MVAVLALEIALIFLHILKNIIFIITFIIISLLLLLLIIYVLLTRGFVVVLQLKNLHNRSIQKTVC